MSVRDLPKRLFTLTEAAHVLSMGRTRLFSEIRTGRLETVGAGKKRRVTASAIDAYIDLLTIEANAA
ncbi:helix-turn-helix domain-containing protein [Nocardiopsis sp. MG754419]|uniref:helix-turn-helix domain-containing protein n=1 Tax=Nocardiopsis sp. MG754419 TaxID=2259865 RepID=UPI001BAB3E84|nr:helix-turn-helix domain-containing protein [Nocardiopsis sp. MG754419]MBR8743306.1 transcriptional regulator [Nocardiopsis sp. MG754419]